MNSATQIDLAISDAQEAFWAEIAKHYPEITTGDFPPDAHAAFERACSEAAAVWVEGNSPDGCNTNLNSRN
jgi:hypothetical protein